MCAAPSTGASPRTVEKHLQGAYERLGIASASEATATAWAAVGVRLPETWVIDSTARPTRMTRLARSQSHLAMESVI